MCLLKNRGPKSIGGKSKCRTNKDSCLEMSQEKRNDSFAVEHKITWNQLKPHIREFSGQATEKELQDDKHNFSKNQGWEPSQNPKLLSVLTQLVEKEEIKRGDVICVGDTYITFYDGESVIAPFKKKGVPSVFTVPEFSPLYWNDIGHNLFGEMLQFDTKLLPQKMPEFPSDFSILNDDLCYCSIKLKERNNETYFLFVEYATEDEKEINVLITKFWRDGRFDVADSLEHDADYQVLNMDPSKVLYLADHQDIDWRSFLDDDHDGPDLEQIHHFVYQALSELEVDIDADR